MKSLSRIIIGSAQFGLDYGITNYNGKVSSSIVRRIAELSESLGISGFDTAQTYGDSEIVLGNNLQSNHDFILISKLKPQSKNSFNSLTRELWERDFKKTLNNLKVSKLDAFLVHSSDDLIRPDGRYLLEWLKSLISRNLVNKIGVSLYDVDEINKLPLSEIQILQFPISLYDQRFYTSGAISRLKNLGLTLMGRSIYLQGLILQEYDKLPRWVPSSILDHHKSLVKYSNSKGVSLIQIAIQFAMQIKDIDYFVIGITDEEELRDLDNACRTTLKEELDYHNFAINNLDFIDPRRWNNKY
tara:strand:- start:105 stop:1004 length:900 start_codon:yes stop_codon:yes gene_type:complete